MGNWVKLAFLSLRKKTKKCILQIQENPPCVDDVILMMAMTVGAVFNYAKDDDEEEEDDGDGDGDRGKENAC